MLAGRLIQAINDILGEYSEFRIIAQLEAASNLSSQRAQLPPTQYIQQARQLRDWAQSVIDRSKVDKYPYDLQRFINESKYSSALPEHIAKIILAGFPDDLHRTISSSELGLYLQLARTLQSELTAFTQTANKLNVERIIIPPDEVSFDVILPRNLFDDKVDEFIELLSKFARIMSYLNELITGSERSPTVVYTSTSDLVTGLALAYAVAWAFLTFYKLVLEVAEKQLSLLKTLKEFRAFLPDSSTNIEEKTNAIVADALQQAVDGAVASVPTKVPEERINEIKNAISRDTRVVMQAIANGARIGITIESLDKISDISKAVPGLTPEKVHEVLRDQRVLEHQVQQSLVSLGQPAPALLPIEKSGPDKR